MAVTTHYSPRPLNPTQIRFVEEYIKDPSSSTKAAKRAGYSISTACEQGSRLLNDPRVQRLIEEATQEAIHALGITKERVLQELAVIAFSNPSAVVSFDEHGEPTIDMNSLRSDKKGSIEVSVGTMTGRGGKTKIVNVKTIKPADKIAALVQLGKAMNMFSEKVEITNKLSLQDLIEQSFQPTTSIEQPVYEQIESISILEADLVEQEASGI